MENQIVVSQDSIINAHTRVSSGGWGDSNTSTITIDNGEIVTTGGISYKVQGHVVGGFSITAGIGNYGYYLIDLEAEYSGVMEIDMNVSCIGGGNSLFTIYATNDLYEDGKFAWGAKQIWGGMESLSLGNPFERHGFNGETNAWVVNKLASVPFKGRYLYIGAFDLGGGQSGIAIKKIKLTENKF